MLLIFELQQHESKKLMDTSAILSIFHISFTQLDLTKHWCLKGEELPFKYSVWITLTIVKQEISPI